MQSVWGILDWMWSVLLLKKAILKNDHKWLFMIKLCKIYMQIRVKIIKAPDSVRYV